MASDIALLCAAAGLEKLMIGGPKNMPIQDSNVAQISAALYYQANVVAKLYSNKKFKELFTNTIFNQIEKDFGAYIDAKARSNPKSLHHVYEWKKVGNQNARLFELTMIPSQGISFKITSNFKPSVSFVPTAKGKRKHVFTNKAAIMEAGRPLVIRPRHAQRLVFDFNGVTYFMPKGKSVTIKKPGGAKASNQYHLAYGRYFSGNLVNESIKKSGFQRIFGQATAKSLKIPSSIKKVKYSFTANSVQNEADMAVAAAYGGVIL